MPFKTIAAEKKSQINKRFGGSNSESLLNTFYDKKAK